MFEQIYMKFETVFSEPPVTVKYNWSLESKFRKAQTLDRWQRKRDDAKFSSESIKKETG